MARTTIALALPLSALLGLTAGCAGGGSGDDASTTVSASSSSSSSAATTPESSTSSSSSSTASSSSSASKSSNSDASGSLTAARAAIAAANAKAGGAVVDLERDDDGWEVTLVRGSTKTKVHVDAAGKNARVDDKDSVDSDKQRLLGSVKVPLSQALATAIGTSKAAVKSAELDDEDDKPVYKVELGGSSERTVHVDARTGKVLGAGSDDDGSDD